jgi:hypothetical protein
VKTTVENDLVNISNLLNAMELGVLYIIEIIIDDTFECEIFELEQQSQVKYIKVGLKVFMNNFLEDNTNF